jgi:hypothetical protein
MLNSNRRPINLSLLLFFFSIFVSLNQFFFNFVAFVANLMQVPASITLSNGGGNQRNNVNYPQHTSAVPMDIPEKLTRNYKRTNFREFV